MRRGEANLEAALAAAELLHRAGDLDGALAAYEKSAILFPAEPEPLFRLGLVHAQKGKLELAESALRQAIALEEQPHYLYALGDVYERAGHRAEAVSAWQRAVRLRPEFANAHARLGLALADDNRPDEAILAFRRAVSFAPRDKRSWWNLGAMLSRAGADRLALDALEETVRLSPEHARAWELLGAVRLRCGEVMAARDAFCQATRIDVSLPGAWLGLANCDTHLGNTREVLTNLDRAEALKPADAAQIASQRLIAMHYTTAKSTRAVFEAHLDWARRYAPARGKTSGFRPNQDPGKKLRIGYLSPRFHRSSAASLSLSVLLNHDKTQFQVYCYAEQSFEDDVTRLFRNSSSGWRTTAGQSDEAVANQIRADGIDILVDLAGHTPGHRLPVLAWRAAPVQATWLDYFNTTGIDAVNFIISDPVHSPPEALQPFVERVTRLPALRYCWTPPTYAPEVRQPAACTGASPVFGSFNRLAKLSGETLDVWCRLLRQLPEARLIVKNSALGGEPERAHVRSWFKCRGIDPSRIDLRGASSHATMLDEYLEIDVALDTFPYNGGLTTLEALWMGRPVVALRGETMISRQSLAILSAIGMPELVATNTDAYVHIACTLVEHPEQLAQVSAGLRRRMRDSAATDVPRFTRDLEALYRHEWKRWCEKPAPGIA